MPSIRLTGGGQGGKSDEKNLEIFHTYIVKTTSFCCSLCTMRGEGVKLSRFLAYVLNDWPLREDEDLICRTCFLAQLKMTAVIICTFELDRFPF